MALVPASFSLYISEKLNPSGQFSSDKKPASYVPNVSSVNFPTYPVLVFAYTSPACTDFVVTSNVVSFPLIFWSLPGNIPSPNPAVLSSHPKKVIASKAIKAYFAFMIVVS